MNIPMQVVKFDVVGAQLGQRALELLPHVLGCAIDLLNTSRKVDAELGSEEYLVAFASTLEPI
jgi:hypothetical protein